MTNRFSYLLFNTTTEDAKLLLYFRTSLNAPPQNFLQIWRKMHTSNLMQSCRDRLKKVVCDDWLTQTTKSFSQVPTRFYRRIFRSVHTWLSTSSCCTLTDCVLLPERFPTNEITLELQLVILFVHLVCENCTAPRFANSNLNLPLV